jgi:predicted phosphodiesterase
MQATTRSTAALAGVLFLGLGSGFAEAQQLALPRRDGSVRFAVIGDAGTGGREQVEVAAQLERYRRIFPYTFAIMLGDNIYGAERPQDMEKKFARPYRPLLDAKVEFHAALGNHDDPNQRYYKPFNLGGERYRTFKKGNVRFFVIDSNYLDPEQVKWLERELAASGSDWKIPYFHHPLYTSARRGPEVELRAVLEPLFLKYGVDVVFSGHEHVYERIKPQRGIYYFTAGGAAKLRKGDTRQGELVEKAFATDRSFMLVEIDKDRLYFQAVSRAGETVDKGVITRREMQAKETTASNSKPKTSAPNSKPK